MFQADIFTVISTSGWSEESVLAFFFAELPRKIYTHVHTRHTFAFLERNSNRPLCRSDEKNWWLQKVIVFKWNLQLHALRISVYKHHSNNLHIFERVISVNYDIRNLYHRTVITLGDQHQYNLKWLKISLTRFFFFFFFPRISSLSLLSFFQSKFNILNFPRFTSHTRIFRIVDLLSRFLISQASTVSDLGTVIFSNQHVSNSSLKYIRFLANFEIKNFISQVYFQPSSFEI